MRATEKNMANAISTVGDITTGRKCLTFHPDQYIKIILAAMQTARTGCAAVVDDTGALTGLLTEREVLRHIFRMVVDPTISHANLGKHLEDMKVRDVMIAAPATLDDTMDIEDALDRMTELGFRFMPVLNHKTRALIGVADERELAIHVKNRLAHMRREKAQKDAVISYLFHEPYGAGYTLHTV
jgi:CBS domain-containing protein